MLTTMTNTEVAHKKAPQRAFGFKKTALATLVLLSIGMVAACSGVPPQSNPDISADRSATLPSSAEVLAQMEKVANWQLPRIDHLSYLDNRREESLDPKKWVQGAFYAGLTQIAERSENPFYTNWISYKGAELNWELGPRIYFADDQVIAQTYIWHYLNHNQDERFLAPTKAAFETILANPPTNSLELTEPRDENRLHSCQARWCWADALFMAPATWLGLSEATGDPRYAEYAYKEARATVEYLFDEEHDLLYRDSRFKTRTGDFGEPLFWARGSGWVFAGLARMMEFIPEDHPERDYYETLFLRMAAKLKSLQKKDGSWAMSLLAGDKMPQPETSGTGFFTYGLAWGIKNGLLDAAEYEETVAKGWNVLNAAVHPDGKLGWVQAIGAAPASVSYDDSQIYGVGAYLLAGSAIYDIMAARERVDATDTSEAGQSSTINAPRVLAFARFVPEHQDDFAWEAADDI
ncbi:MAG: glycoside hydrolase family 88 protein, partial [Gammaproteobacteria bacterium]|nr:glycoside hydrolase family 88 protein [Gammaproteobacteria bacterium]